MSKEKFEDALGKLEEIVRRMEAGEMSLEESLKAFEEGIKLSRLCAKKLDEADRRVEPHRRPAPQQAGAPEGRR